ncbi:MAG: hypothetical protein GY701_28720 [Sulfitobacter sp.]|nr:hypothetical protein [Sulfitobacter sp.]
MNMQSQIRRNTVLSAVQRKMFCEVTGTCLDVDRAYLVTDRLSGSTCIISGEAFRALELTDAQKRLLEVWEGKTGREVWKPEGFNGEASR